MNSDLLDVSFQKSTTSDKKYGNQKIWTAEEDRVLVEVHDLYKNQSKKWKKVSGHIATKTPKQCYSRFRQINPSFKQGVWSIEEEDKLRILVKKYGKKWAEIAKIFKTRSGKQIRHHYINILDEHSNRTSFTQEEDDKIRELYFKYGPRWKKISDHFECRTGDIIKNRFYNKIKNTIEGFKHQYGNIFYKDRNQVIHPE